MRTTFASIAFASLLAACGGNVQPSPHKNDNNNNTNNNNPPLNCGPAPGATTVSLDDSANGTTVSVGAGDAIAIKLAQHTDGGFVWSMTDDGGLGPANETHIAASSAAGAAGYDVFTIGTIGAASGSHTIKLTDARSDGTQDATFTVTVVLPGGTTESVTIDVTQNGSTVDVPRGEPIVLHLASLGDAGYQWSFVDDGALGAPTQTHEAGSGTPGDFGYDDFTFPTSGVSPGTYVIHMVDERSFDTSSAMPWSVTVVVQ